MGKYIIYDLLTGEAKRIITKPDSDGEPTKAILKEGQSFTNTIFDTETQLFINGEVVSKNDKK